ncbi:MAG: sigma 54-interacting transcriptional regulator [Syntrophales bacterium]|jgi:transcriptional regulator with GAF, ATPase, and Fis domain|nr:sigma 54-interacting transcriptional regulator [Syntrophales bacterium]MDY0044300.1 sigma 54-interacting transcriptional regulator [Syntrophales bacterium]
MSEAGHLFMPLVRPLYKRTKNASKSDLKQKMKTSEEHNHRRILSLAALFDGEFHIDWLQELANEKASKIFSALEYGVTNRFLASSNSFIFSFISRTAQKGLMDDISADEKKALHRRIIKIFLQAVPDGPDRTKKIAFHLLHITNNLDECRLLIEAGNLHRKSFRDDEARRYYDKAIESLKTMKGHDVSLLFIEAALQYAKASADNTDPAKVISIIKKAIGRARSNGYNDYAGFLEMHLGKSEWLRSRYRPALHHFKNGWALTRKIDDPAIQRSATIFGMFFHYWSGNYREVVQSYETLVPDVENTFPKDSLPLLAALTAGVCLGHTGVYSQALGMLHAIQEHGRSIGNLSVAGLAGITIGYLLLELNRPEDSLHYIEESLKEATKSRNVYAQLNGLALLCYASHLVNDHRRALSALQDYFELSGKAKLTVKFSAVWLLICWAVEEGSFPRVEGISLEEDIRYSFESGNLLMKGVACRYKALLHRKQGRPPQDVMCELKKSVRHLESSGHQIELAKTKIELAREYLRAGSETRAMKWAKTAAKTLYSFNDELVPDDIRPLVKDLRFGENLLEEILGLSQELTTILDYKDLSRHIIATINRITGAERGAIFLLEDDSHDIVLRAAKNLTSKDITNPGFETSMKLIEETLKSGNGRIRELNEHSAPNPAGADTIRSCICVPMTIRNKTVGVLYHDNRLFCSAFKKQDLKILNYFAAQAAISMDNARSWQAMNEMYEKQTIEKRYYENEYLETIHFEDFVGKSPAIMKVFSQVEQVAGTDATVLILGETGVGKELIARSIHRHSSRNGKPFIRVHCSALPESLISSELFGHEKGAFTGANSRHMGRFELAHGGTIFLDEIGDISMEIQVKLLRVLQSGEFERVGGHHTLKSDFRLLAATNRDLQKEVETGRFRQDLYYRLNVFPINVPALRDRKDDIPLLAHYFLTLYAGKFNKPLETIARNDMEKLLAYSWPGNVRELENVIERSVILSNGSHLRIPELGDKSSPLFTDKPFASLKKNERDHIISALQRTNGKVTGPGGAADLLEIHPNTLFSRMKKLGIHKRARYYSSDK